MNIYLYVFFKPSPVRGLFTSAPVGGRAKRTPPRHLPSNWASASGQKTERVERDERKRKAAGFKVKDQRPDQRSKSQKGHFSRRWAFAHHALSMEARVMILAPLCFFHQAGSNYIRVPITNTLVLVSRLYLHSIKHSWSKPQKASGDLGRPCRGHWWTVAPSSSQMATNSMILKDLDWSHGFWRR